MFTTQVVLYMDQPRPTQLMAMNTCEYDDLSSHKLFLLTWEVTLEEPDDRDHPSRLAMGHGVCCPFDSLAEQDRSEISSR